MRLTRCEHPFRSAGSLYGQQRWRYPGEDGIHRLLYREHKEPPIRQGLLRRPSVGRLTTAIRFWSDKPQSDGPNGSVCGPSNLSCVTTRHASHVRPVASQHRWILPHQ